MIVKSKMGGMNTRLKDARIAAGFVTATDAIDHWGWKASTYRAHENGQNNFNVAFATMYGKAYGVTAMWLLTGERIDYTTVKSSLIQNKSNFDLHKHDCVEHIYATALLLREDKENLNLLGKLQNCVESQIGKIK